MIRVTLTDDTTTIVGHSQYANIGNDIVCAGVSAIIQTAILGLHAMARGYGGFLEINDQRTHRPWPNPQTDPQRETAGVE